MLRTHHAHTRSLRYVCLFGFASSSILSLFCLDSCASLFLYTYVCKHVDMRCTVYTINRPPCSLLLASCRGNPRGSFTTTYPVSFPSYSIQIDMK
ncbi:uncharacterized protein IWZ02DRAFT_84475 [Phyllosticta citriasiana]|uniref:uncharacterized protein n=1 Tax=Phyllosticta citriasiana TaxID=595635 RepID=UPI0030FD3DC7